MDIPGTPSTPDVSARQDSDFLIDRILPTREVHLIFGPSGSGKTTLALQIADALSRGETAFGYPTHPARLCYVSCTRSESSIQARLRDLEIDARAIPHFALPRCSRDERTVSTTVAKVLERFGHALKLIILDGFSALCPGRINDHRDVSQLLADAAHLCRREDLTIIGCIASAKSREEGGYVSPRDRVLGSIAWMESTETKILIEPMKPSKPLDPHRLITVMPQHEAPQEFYYRFDASGRLIPTELNVCAVELDEWLATIPLEDPVYTHTILEVSAALGISRASAFRWIDDKLETGRLIRIARGAYRIAVPPVN